MNPWDIVTWLAAFALAATAAVIFVFFLRDARSILDREMHGPDDEAEDSWTSGATAGRARPTPPEDCAVSIIALCIN